MKLNSKVIPFLFSLAIMPLANANEDGVIFSGQSEGTVVIQTTIEGTGNAVLLQETLKNHGTISTTEGTITIVSSEGIVELTATEQAPITITASESETGVDVIASSEGVVVVVPTKDEVLEVISPEGDVVVVVTPDEKDVVVDTGYFDGKVKSIEITTHNSDKTDNIVIINDNGIKVLEPAEVVERELLDDYKDTVFLM